MAYSSRRLISVALTVASALVAIGWSAKRSPHTTQTTETWERSSFKILILGGGFGGVATAIALDHELGSGSDASVLLVERGNAQVFVPLLWTVADGRSSPANVMVPIRSYQRGRAFHVLHASVEHVDLERRIVKTSAGERPYDCLVIALGSITKVPERIPGAREHAHVFRSPADALQLRNRIINALEGAHQTSDASARAAWLTFVVIGGGDTGTELAVTIYDYARRAIEEQYPWLVDRAIRVTIVESLDRLVPLSSVAVSQRVRASLERRGIVVRTSAEVERIDEDAVYTKDATIPTHTVFWSAGIAPPQLVRDIEAEHAKNGALLVDDRLRVRGHSEVYAIGDNAWAVDSESGQPVPALAQAAEREAVYVARAIAADRSGTRTKPFRFTKLGQMTLLGDYDAVAELGPLTLTGPIAWLAWHGYYATQIGSWRNRVSLILSWLIAAFLGRETSELPLEVTG